jgi:hypothetical protein
MALILAGFLVVVAPEVTSAALMRDRRHRPGQGHHYVSVFTVIDGGVCTLFEGSRSRQQGWGGGSQATVSPARRTGSV